MTNEFKESIRDLIRKAKTEKALQELQNWAHRNNDAALTDKVTELIAQLKKTNNDVMYGYITDNEADVKQRRLVKTVLDLLQEMGQIIPTTPSVKPDADSTKSDNNPLKILMLTALPAKTVEIDTNKEFARIWRELQGKQGFNLLIENNVSVSEFKQFTETNQPQVLHFSGHGINGGDKGGIVLQNDNKNGYELLSPDKLDFLFKYFKRSFQIQAVILNACLSEEQAAAIARHVSYVVGTTDEIEDAYSIAFSIEFYFKLVQSNRNFELAFDSGRTGAVLKGAKESDFVFYKDGKIWAIDTPQ
jgi:CHAT domain-containing protein